MGEGQKGYCCTYTALQNKQGGSNNPLANVSNLGINSDGPNWYLPSDDLNINTKITTDGNVAKVVSPMNYDDTQTGFTSCVELGK